MKTEFVAEIIASYRGTVLDVQHVAPAAKRSKARAHALMGLGAAAVLGGLALFAHEAAQDWDTFRADTMAAADAGQALPEEPGLGIGGWAALLGLLGLVPFAAGLAMSRDKQLEAYTIGEHDGATFHAPMQLDLVKDGRLAFTEEMKGTITTGGTTCTTADLIADGRATPCGAFYTVPLPGDARCRLEHGSLTFHVNAVEPGKNTAGRGRSDKAFWAYNAASLAAIGGLIAMAHLALADSGEMALDDQIAVNRYVGYVTQPDDFEPDDTQGRADGDDLGDGEKLAGTTAGAHAKGPAGKAGDPKAAPAQRRRAAKGPSVTSPKFARGWNSREAAQKAGILAQIHARPGAFVAMNGQDAFTISSDDENAWGDWTSERAGSAYGEMGASLVGDGRGGDGTAEGTEGLGDVGLVGQARIGENADGVKRASGIHYDHGPGVKHRDRGHRVPSVRAAKAKTVCAGATCLDKDTIRRVVRSHINEVRYCYNQGLVGDPNLRGRVAVQFRIGSHGQVQASVVSSSTLGDASVGQCIAKAVKRWKFPAAPGGLGSVMVTYPFQLSPG